MYSQTKIQRPIFIVSSPRAGSTLLFQTLGQSPDLCTIGGESHALIESVHGLHPRERSWTSNRLEGADATSSVANELRQRFGASLRDRNGRTPPTSARMLEKTPKNSLRIPFLKEIFPDAVFVYLYRDVRETLSSMIEAWQSGNFRTYPRLPGWTGTPWSLVLVPQWYELIGRPLHHIVAQQWKATTTQILDDLAALPPEDRLAVGQAEFLADPQTIMVDLCTRLDLRWDRTLTQSLPLSPTVVSRPRPDKWQRHRREIEDVHSIVAETAERARTATKALTKPI